MATPMRSPKNQASPWAVGLLVVSSGFALMAIWLFSTSLVPF